MRRPQFQRELSRRRADILFTSLARNPARWRVGRSIISSPSFTNEATAKAGTTAKAVPRRRIPVLEEHVCLVNRHGKPSVYNVSVRKASTRLTLRTKDEDDDDSWGVCGFAWATVVGLEDYDCQQRESRAKALPPRREADALHQQLQGRSLGEVCDLSRRNKFKVLFDKLSTEEILIKHMETTV